MKVKPWSVKMGRQNHCNCKKEVVSPVGEVDWVIEIWG
jgi:hypothetical protein